MKQKTEIRRTIICLSAPASKGKTSSIRKLYEKLGGVFNTDEHDFVGCIGYGEYKIGCISYGDPGTSPEESIRKLIDDEDCDIIVSASRSYGDTVDEVKDLAQKRNCNYIRFSPIYMCEEAENILNDECHETNINFILEIIHQIIAGKI